MERINDRISQAVMETCLAMTIFREEFNVEFCTMFTVLTFIKVAAFSFSKKQTASLPLLLLSPPALTTTCTEGTAERPVPPDGELQFKLDLPLDEKSRDAKPWCQQLTPAARPKQHGRDNCSSRHSSHGRQCRWHSSSRCCCQCCSDTGLWSTAGAAADCFSA